MKFSRKNNRLPKLSLKNLVKSVLLILLFMQSGFTQTIDAYVYDGAIASYGTINLATGAFTTMTFRPQGNEHYPVTADNDTLDSQYTIMADFTQSNFFLWHVNFATLSGTNIAPVGPFASGQNRIKGMAYNKVTETWYVVSGNATGSAAYLYTINLNTGVLSVVGQIQNANFPVGIAIDCNGNAYIINIVTGSPSNTAILNSLNLSTAAATPIGTNLGLQFVTGFSQDMAFNPDNGNLYWTGYWQQGFSEGASFRLVNVMSGTSTQIAAYGQFHNLTGFNVNRFCPAPTTFQVSVDVANGWNMVSIPGLNTPDQNVNTWWSFRDPGANVFKYLGGYQSITDAVPGTGYWMKHSGARTYNTGDEWPAGGIQIVAPDPLAGASGWNMIGGYELSVSAAGVTTNPPGLQSGPIYKYSSGYQTATTLDPGYGYWIKLSGAGQIIIPETLSKGKESEEYFPEEWGKIILTDAEGISYSLYGVKGETDLTQYELPPTPMTGMFDIRYSSGRIAEDLSNPQSIEMNSVSYPVKVRVENMKIRIQNEEGKDKASLLKPRDEITIRDTRINKITVLGGEVISPVEYTLEQNYPNPFNPSTTIKFTLPEASDVTLSIYNTLGQKVTELVNGKLEAGKYNYQWNARDVATGMYIYELRADPSTSSGQGFVSVKKMILLK